MPTTTKMNRPSCFVFVAAALAIATMASLVVPCRAFRPSSDVRARSSFSASSSSAKSLPGCFASGRRRPSPSPFAKTGGRTTTAPSGPFSSIVVVAAKKTAKMLLSSSTDASRAKRASGFADWAKSAGIKFGGVEVKPTPYGGLGLASDRPLNPSDLLAEVPTPLTLSVRVPADYDGDVERTFFGEGDRRAYRDAPWWARMSLKVNYLDKVSSYRDGVDVRPWLDVLPRNFDTPLHWTQEQRLELQYPYLSDSVSNQEKQWKVAYDDLVRAAGGPSSKLASTISYDEFVWGCEVARSRAFSGSYSGGAFDPKPYALTLILVALYVLGGFGSVEQAANGAGLVFCGTVLKDFVFPKLFKSKSYVICPFIDMANHVGSGESGEVSFEYFADGYSLSAKRPLSANSELFVSYGPRTNDQLLQFYGFVEADNIHDVYVMPPLREWDIGELEKVCGRTFNPGRLAKLDRAGLLGRPPSSDDDDVSSDDEGAANVAGGVVITRSAGIDPAVLQALRALVSTDEEWDAASESIGNFSTPNSGGGENERLARLAVKTAMESELDSRDTTIEEDESTLRGMESGGKFSAVDPAEVMALRFRIEKKRLLSEAIDRLG